MQARILILSLLVSQVCFSQTFDFLTDFETNKQITFSFVRNGYPTGVFMDTLSRFDAFEGSIDVSTDSIAFSSPDSTRVYYLSLRKIGIETIKTSTRIVSTRSIDTGYTRTINEYLTENYGAGDHRIHGWIIPDTVQQRPLCPNEEDSTIYYRYPYYFRHYSFPTTDTLDLRADTLVLRDRLTDCLDFGMKWESRLTTSKGLIEFGTYLFNYFGWSESENYTKALVTGLASVNQPGGSYFLCPNYPNPFNPSTQISYQLAKAGYVRVQVFDLLGRTVQVLVDGYETSGPHEVTFQANQLPSGVYICSLRTEGFVQSRKLLLVH